jgi:hypothetical protein
MSASVQTCHELETPCTVTKADRLHCGQTAWQQGPSICTLLTRTKHHAEGSLTSAGFSSYMVWTAQRRGRPWCAHNPKKPQRAVFQVWIDFVSPPSVPSVRMSASN